MEEGLCQHVLPKVTMLMAVVPLSAAIAGSWTLPATVQQLDHPADPS
jgi:hypothetical protein